MKLLKYLLSVICVLSFSLVIVGCNCDGGEQNQGGAHSGTRLNRTSLALEVLEVYELKVENSDSVYEWSSSDDKIASVDANGLVTGISAGSAKVSAKSGSENLTCEVTVLESADIPVLNIFNKEIGLLKGGEYQIQSDVIYKGERYNDAKCSYKTGNAAIATVDDNGNVKGVEVGSTKVVVTAEWKIFKGLASLTETVTIDVKPNVSVESKLLDGKLYNADVTVFGTRFSSSMPLVAETKINGKATDKGKIEWFVSDPSIAKIENGQLKAVTIGETDVYCKYSVDGYVVTSLPRKITVAKPFLDLTDEQPILIDTFIGGGKTEITGDLSECFEANEKVTAVSDVATGASVDFYDASTGKYDSDKVVLGYHVWDIENSVYTIRSSVFVATKVIYTAKELVNLQTYGSVAKYKEHEVGSEIFDEYRYSGYFALANDIVFEDDDYGEGKTNLAPECMYSGSVQVTTWGFKGVFDGLGHSIINVKVGDGGIFGDISSEGEVKNLNVYNAFMLKGTQNGIIAKNISGALTNVNVTADLNGNYESATLAYLIYGGALRDVSVYAAGVRENKEGASFAIWTKGTVGAINCSVNELNCPVIKNDEGGIRSKISRVNYDVTAENEITVYSGTLNPRDIVIPVSGKVESVWIAGRTITNDVQTENGKVILKSELLPKVLLGGENLIKIITDKTSYRVKTIVSAFAINTAEDFDDFIARTETTTFYQKTVNVGSDVDFTGYAYKNGKGFVRGKGAGFNGTLNGNGHVLKNLKVSWTLFSRCYNANINNLAFVDLEFQANYVKGLIEECAGSTIIDNVYIRSSHNYCYNRDYAIAETVSGSATIKNCVIDRVHAVKGYVAGIINGNASLTLSNVYVIGDTSAVAETPDGKLYGGENAIYTNNPQGALTAITTAGLTSEKGWNTGIWSFGENGKLLFNDIIVINK